MTSSTDDRPAGPRTIREWVPGERLSRTRRRPRVSADVDDGPEPPADAPAVGVLALQGDVLEHLRALRRCGVHARRVRRPADLDGLDGLVLPGGESTTIGKLLDRVGLLDELRTWVAADRPTFGTCAGMILLSDELDQDEPQPLIGGLPVVTRRNAFGRQVDSFERELQVAGIDGPPLRTAFIRAPWIERVERSHSEHADRAADGVEVLAEVDGHPVIVRRGNLLAAAFHPEVTGDDRLHALFCRMVRDAADAARLGASTTSGCIRPEMPS